MAEKIMHELKKQVKKGEFFLTAPVDRIPTKASFSTDEAEGGKGGEERDG